MRSEGEKNKEGFTTKDLFVAVIATAIVITEMLTFGKLFGMGLVMRSIMGGLIFVAAYFGFMIEKDNEVLVVYLIKVMKKG